MFIMKSVKIISCNTIKCYSAIEIIRQSISLTLFFIRKILIEQEPQNLSKVKNKLRTPN